MSARNTKNKSEKMVKKVLMICLGNICRSPIAEAVFAHLIEQKGVKDKWEVDSAALGEWHVGRQPDQRARKVLADRNIAYEHRARVIDPNDFYTFDFIFGMDTQNMDALRELAPKDSTANVLLLGDFDPQEVKIIRDPYYDDGAEGFVKCYEQCMRCCSAFIDENPPKNLLAKK